MRVLVVESDPATTELFAAVLGDEGHEVAAVPDRTAALTLLRAGRWDACLCDGFEPDAVEPTAADLAELAAFQARVPVVLCTAHSWAHRLGPAARHPLRQERR